MAQVKIQALANGPLQITGDVDVLDSQGDVMKSGATMFLCRCGQSARKPFCDSTHRKAGFQSVCTRQTDAAK